MQLIINVPDTLPQERLAQIIKEVEQNLINEAKSLVSFSKKQPVLNNDPWMNSEVDLPSIDTGIEDFALNHDHYLYGVDKK
ncbi:MAG: hypothetical protein PHN45_08690 [Methylococcales bacterium]|nr:hypothetical protein [Methylococcales bacterium]MDD5754813.1 hypothetical protein [Methylococcales bacterium]